MSGTREIISYVGNTGEDRLIGRYIREFYNTVNHKGRISSDEIIQDIRNTGRWFRGQTYRYINPEPIIASFKSIWYTGGGNYGYIHETLDTGWPNQRVRVKHIFRQDIVTTTNAEGITPDTGPGPNNVAHLAFSVEIEGNPGTRKRLPTSELGSMIHRIRKDGDNFVIYTNLFNTYVNVYYNNGQERLVKANHDGIVIVPDLFNGWGDGCLSVWGRNVGDRSAWYEAYGNDNGAEPWVDFFVGDYFTRIDAGKKDGNIEFKVYTANSWVSTNYRDLYTNRVFNIYGSRKGWHREWARVPVYTLPGDRIKLKVDGGSAKHVLAIRVF